MTKEVDNLIAIGSASQSGCFAGYTTNGSHTTNSYHERPGTPSTTGAIGLAVDFDAPNNDSRDLLTCAQYFLKFSSQLAELFHTPLGKWVKNGIIYPIGALDPHDIALHYNHVHVAINKGTVLTAPNQPQIVKVDNMPGPQGQVDACSSPNGGQWFLTSDGGVRCESGAPFYGSYPGLPADQRQGNRFFIAIEPLNGGYRIFGSDDTHYDFHP